MLVRTGLSSCFRFVFFLSFILEPFKTSITTDYSVMWVAYLAAR